MGIMRRFYEEHAWWDLVPAGNEGSAVLARKCPLAAVAKDGNLAVAYYPAAAHRQLALKLVKGPWHMDWFDPRTGDSQSAGTILAAGEPLVLPAKPSLDDWLLVLEREDEDI